MSRSSPTGGRCRRARRSPSMCFPALPPVSPPAWCSSAYAFWRTRRSMPTAPDSPELIQPSKRGGRMSELAAVEEVPVWLEGNGQPVVTWMCTPELLEELAIGWLHGEGYIDRLEQVHLRPCATDLGFWAEVPPEKVAAVQAEGRRPVLASGCGAVSTFLADPGTVEVRPPRGMLPESEQLRALFKALFGQGTRYKD